MALFDHGNVGTPCPGWSTNCSLTLVFSSGLNLELGFPLTGLERLESVVGLPDFSGPFSEEDYISNQESHFQEHFASQIVLRRLVVDFHGVLSQGMPRLSLSSASSFLTEPDYFAGSVGFSPLGAAQSQFSPATTGSRVNQMTLQQLAHQLEQWLGVLPAHLRWEEDSPGAFPNAKAEVYNAGLYGPARTSISPAIPTTQATARTPTSPLMFTTDLDAVPTRYPYLLDTQVALLRSHYYYTKYLIHRPFVYKALHHPDAMVHDDAIGVAECLKASLKWPVAMSPPCKNKRMISCTFFFTQNFFGILLLLHLSTTVPMLRHIRGALCGERFELDASETVALYLDWLRDVKAVDSGVEWHWQIVRTIYGLDD